MNQSVNWSFSAIRLDVQLNADVLQGINQEMFRGVDSLPRRGVEVGGILLGRVEGQTARAVVIEGFDPVPCKYQDGPSYRLCDEDRAVLEQKLSRWKPGPDRRLSAVGFYRSHTRGELCADEEDSALCRTYFPEAAGVFLLIRPRTAQVGLAGLFLWRDGSLEREPACEEFLLEPGEPEPAIRDAGPEPAPAPRPPARAMFPPPARRSPGTWLWAPCGALALLALAWWGAGAFLPESVPVRAAPQPQAVELRLAATESAGQIEISWNRSAPAVRLARNAILTITDGPHRREMELDAEQLRSMQKVLYTRVSPDLRLRLEVFGERRSVSESVRVGTPAR